VPAKISKEQRQAIVSLLDEGLPRQAIARALGVTPGQVSAVAAHVTMRTYGETGPTEQPTPLNPMTEGSAEAKPGEIVLDSIHSTDVSTTEPAAPLQVLLGTDTRTGADICWLPSPASNTLNPHLLILGESGSGKTYAVQCICAELVQKGVPIIVFDYGQGIAARLFSGHPWLADRETISAYDRN
jgi:hypothetical protein